MFLLLKLKKKSHMSDPAKKKKKNGKTDLNN